MQMIRSEREGEGGTRIEEMEERADDAARKRGIGLYPGVRHGNLKTEDSSSCS